MRNPCEDLKYTLAECDSGSAVQRRAGRILRTVIRHAESGNARGFDAAKRRIYRLDETAEDDLVSWAAEHAAGFAFASWFGGVVAERAADNA